MTHVLGGVLPSDEAPGVPAVVVAVQGHGEADVEGGGAVGEAAGVQFNRHFRDVPITAPNYMWSFETCISKRTRL